MSTTALGCAASMGSRGVALRAGSDEDARATRAELVRDLALLAG